jgi:hypothetical protein
MTLTLELIIPIAVSILVAMGFIIKLFRNNWKQPFAKLITRVDALEIFQKTSTEKYDELKANTTTDIQRICNDITQLRNELSSNLKILESEYLEAIDDREERLAEKISDQSRRIEKLDDYLREVSKELIQVARFWNDPQHYRIQK